MANKSLLPSRITAFSVLKTMFTIVSLLVLVSCGGDEWYCVEDGDVMYSRSKNGEWGGAERACSCSKIRAFEKKVFGSVDEAALKRDFGC